MSLKEIIESFRAFNINAATNLIYNVKNNLWIILIIVGVIAITAMNLMEEIEDVVPEEHDIL